MSFQGRDIEVASVGSSFFLSDSKEWICKKIVRSGFPGCLIELKHHHLEEALEESRGLLSSSEDGGLIEKHTGVTTMIWQGTKLI